MGHIFISYSHKDKTYANLLQQHLLEQGFEVWIDDRIDYGAHWPAEIEKCLRGCGAFILIMSSKAYESEWVQNELNLARKLKKPIFPLLLDGEEWWHVGTTQFVDVTGGELPDSKFYARLAAASPCKRGAEAPKLHQPEALCPPIKAWFNRKEIIIAFLGLVGILFFALISTLPWKDWLTSVPASAQTSISTLPVNTPTAMAWPVSITQKGAKMVLIPAGTFIMGSERGFDNEKPVHDVTLDAFYMDVYEVNNMLYKACIEAGGCQLSESTGEVHYTNSKYVDHPIVFIDWEQAKTYCEWRGARLPTEAEWEYAARGTDGRTYPWGEGIDKTFANYNQYVGDTIAVGSYEKGKSPFGIYNMAGNVWEWVSDWYDAYPGNTISNSEYGRTYKVVRGGSQYNGEINLHTSFRNWYLASSRVDNLGFRCARDP